jgi:methionyl aminopeptidase
VSDGTFYAIQGWTFGVGMPTAEDSRLLEGARTALDTAVSAAVAGGTSADLTAVIQRSLSERGLRPSRDVTGHQIGLVPRKGPSLPCAVGVGGEHPTPLMEGMVLSVVVVAHAGEAAAAVADDGWNLVAIDGTRSAHFSHLVVVRRGAPERLTAAHG